MAKLADKRHKGLCYHCDNKYETGHNYRKEKLFVMLDDDETTPDSINEELAIIWEGENGTLHTEGMETEANVSLQANGSSGICTLRLHGIIQEKDMHILVDSGSTYNFISQNLAKMLHLKTSPCSPSNMVANGEKITCFAVIKPVKWTMSGEAFAVNMSVIPLGGYDIILGVQWMTQVSSVTFDYSQGRITVINKAKRFVYNSQNQIRGLICISLKMQ